MAPPTPPPLPPLSPPSPSPPPSPPLLPPTPPALPPLPPTLPPVPPVMSPPAIHNAQPLSEADSLSHKHINMQTPDDSGSGLVAAFVGGLFGCIFLALTVFAFILYRQQQRQRRRSSRGGEAQSTARCNGGSSSAGTVAITSATTTSGIEVSIVSRALSFEAPRKPVVSVVEDGQQPARAAGCTPSS